MILRIVPAPGGRRVVIHRTGEPSPDVASPRRGSDRPTWTVAEYAVRDRLLHVSQLVEENSSYGAQDRQRTLGLLRAFRAMSADEQALVLNALEKPRQTQ